MKLDALEVMFCAALEPVKATVEVPALNVPAVFIQCPVTLIVDALRFKVLPLRTTSLEAVTDQLLAPVSSVPLVRLNEPVALNGSSIVHVPPTPLNDNR